MKRKLKTYRRPKPQPWWQVKWNRAKRQGVVFLAWIGAAALALAVCGVAAYFGG